MGHCIDKEIIISFVFVEDVDHSNFVSYISLKCFWLLLLQNATIECGKISDA